MIRRRREIGCCTAWTKLGSVIVFRNEDYPFDFHGEPLTVKLGDVVCVRLLTPESMAAGRDEDRLDAADDKADEVLS